VAAFAAGVSTALPCDAGAEPAPLVCGAPRLLPVVPLLRAFAVLGPGDPPVPLIVLPFDLPRMPRQMSHRNFAQERKNRPRG